MSLLASRLRLLGGGVVYVAGVGLAYEAFRPIPPLPTCCDRCRTFNELAPGYDREIARDESTSGILDLRKELAARAKGSVLEIAGGTGRNLEYYDAGAVSSLLVGDYSEKMLQVAAHKVALMRQPAQPPSQPVDGAAPAAPSVRQAFASRVTLAVLDACALEVPSGSFDTVVDTFGLCSFEQPEIALAEMARACKPGGQLLLLEHGVSDWSLLAYWQQHRLNRHVVKWGCYWNRDILKLVRESGLRVKEVQRRHLGTTYVIVCEPPAAS